jgi:nitronate monooxygenase
MTAGDRWFSRGGAAALAHTLRVRIPIIQAPMVGVSTPQLAAAVSNAGALGSIGVGASDVDAARTEIQATRSLTGKPFNANFFCHEPTTVNGERERAWIAHMTPLFREFDADVPSSLASPYRSFLDVCDAMSAMLLQEKPPVVSFHFGLPPKSTVAALRGAGIVTLACVTSPREAALAVECDVDALVAQGYEAGGHRGVFDPSRDQQIGTLALVQLLAKTSPSTLPIIAAGGIMNGHGIKAALTLGAAGVQLGTAFILCPESAADRHFRDGLLSDRAYDTRVSAAISGRPARGLVNRIFSDLGGGAVEPFMPSYPIPYAGTKALGRVAKAKGSTEFAVQWAGQSAPLARAMPAAQLVETLVHEVDMVE